MVWRRDKCLKSSRIRRFMQNKITQLFGIQYPIIQAGMVWASGWRLASAVSNAGGLGLLGAGSMYPEVLEEHIIKCKKATDKPFGVNVPMLYPDIEKLMDIIVKHEVKIVFTSAGNPKTWTKFLQENGITVVHVVSSVKFALKAQEAGVDDHSAQRHQHARVYRHAHAAPSPEWPRSVWRRRPVAMFHTL